MCRRIQAGPQEYYDELEPSAAAIHVSPTKHYHRAATVDLHVSILKLRLNY